MSGRITPSWVCVETRDDAQSKRVRLDDGAALTTQVAGVRPRENPAGVGGRRRGVTRTRRGARMPDGGATARRPATIRPPRAWRATRVPGPAVPDVEHRMGGVRQRQGRERGSEGSCPPPGEQRRHFPQPECEGVTHTEAAQAASRLPVRSRLGLSAVRVVPVSVHAPVRLVLGGGLGDVAAVAARARHHGEPLGETDVLGDPCAAQEHDLTTVG